MTAYLKGLRVLVVRPERPGDRLVQLLQTAGAIVYNLPVMKVVSFVDGDRGVAVERQIRSFGQYQKAIFISANAARLFFGWLDRMRLELPGDVEFYAVGESTAAVLRDRDIEVQIPSIEMTSEGLLDLPGMIGVAGQRILLLKGEGGRDTLARELQQRGARVDGCELYRRERTLENQDEIRRLVDGGEVDAILVHSGELLHHLAGMVDVTQLELPAVLPSKRVAQLATDAGYRQCIVAQNATPDAMVEVLKQRTLNRGV